MSIPLSIPALALAAAAAVPGTSSRPPHDLAARHAAAKTPPGRVLQMRIDRTIDNLVVQSDRYWHTGDFGGSAFCNRMIVELDPSDTMAWSDLAWLEWACLNHDDAAEKTLREGITANPDKYDLYMDLGNELLRVGRNADAVPVLEKATRMPGAPSLVWNSYAHSLEKAGKPERAAEVWRRMAKRFPGNPHTDVNLARLKRHGLIQ